MFRTQSLLTKSSQSPQPIRPMSSEILKRTGRYLPGWVLTASTSSSSREADHGDRFAVDGQEVGHAAAMIDVAAHQVHPARRRTMHTRESKPKRFP